MSLKSQQLKKDLLLALEKTRGIVTTACLMVPVDRKTYYRYYNDDEDFRKDVDSLVNVALDFAESKLMERMEGVTIGKVDNEGEVKVYKTPPSDAALIFYLKTKGKKRGYVERVEYEDTNPRPIIIRGINAQEGIDSLSDPDK